jgi:hypothetical protein
LDVHSVPTRRSSDLFEIIATYNISGLLLTSTQMSDVAESKLGTEAWTDRMSGRFTFRQALSGSLRVAVCTHPRFPVSQADVTGAKDNIRSWIEAVMRDYRRKQAER